jgi:hypothetical protein
MELSTGKIRSAQRTVLYGPEGIGKSSLAALWPNPLFLDTESGTEHLDVKRVQITTFDGLIETIDTLIRDPKGVATVVIDTADWAERLALSKVVTTAGFKSIEEFGYGKGFTYLAEEWSNLLFKCRELRDCGFNVVFVAHSSVRKTELPDEAGSFDRYTLKLTATPKNDLSALLKEWADAVLFLNYKTYVTTDKSGKSRASGGKERTLFTTHTAAFDAKNRWGLPEEIQGADVGEIWKTLAPVFEAKPVPVVPAKPKPTAPAPVPEKKAADPAPGAPKFPPKLFDAMTLSGISDEEMLSYLTGNNPLKTRYIPEGTAVANLPASFLKAMLETSNWDKITAAIAAGRKDK